MICDEDDALYFRGRYRIPSTRLPGWDYGRPGYYFLTMCTQGRVPWFGTIWNGQMTVSSIGQIISDEWKRTERVRSHVRLHEWIVMPDHVHGIIQIVNGMDRGGGGDGAWDGDGDGDGAWDGVETFRRNVSTAIAPTTAIAPPTASAPPNASLKRSSPGAIGSIVNQFKSICTKRIRIVEPDFTWQPRFHDHVIRDEEELDRIRRYILRNPAAWWKRHGGRS